MNGYKLTKNMNIIRLFSFIALFASNVFAATVAGYFPTSTINAGTSVVLSNRVQVFTAIVGTDGKFYFSTVDVGQYDFQISSNTGYTLKQPLSVAVSLSSDNILLGSVGVQKYVVAGSNYSYLWAQDQTYAGTEATSNIVAPTIVTLLGNGYQMSDISYADRLKSMYNIILMDSAQPWDSERAYRLFITLDSIPYTDTGPYRFNASTVPTIWKLTSDYLDQDIKIETVNGVKTITISTAAFTYAAPFVAQIEDRKGLYFSKRLHHALLLFATNYGTDSALIETILQKRFGVTTQIPDYLALTGELAGRFQPFRPNELIQILNSFEELPEGFHVIPTLKYLVRRLDGTINIKYPEAVAMAWPSGYIEFMEKAFARANEIDLQRLILHEKGHFIYGSMISPAIRDAWIKLGGWYQDANGNWTTTKTTEFVSAYSHGKNPNEDFAETVSAFVTNPDILKSRSMAKYEFLRDAVMFGNSYVSQIRSDLTFQVLNLFPNYNFPGKIKRIQVSVSGSPEEDKVVTCEMELQPVGTKDNPVKSIYMRVYGPRTKELPVAPYFDWYFSPISEGSNVFRGSCSISKYFRRGYWAPDQIVITDSVGNQRYERAVLYGWKCYIDNPLQDIAIPEYVANSIKMYVNQKMVDGRQVQVLSVDWDVTDDRGLASYASFVKPPGDNQYTINSWGSPFFGNGTAHTEYVITEFFPSGVYKVPQILLNDYGVNIIYPYFTNGGGGPLGDGLGIKLDEPTPSITIITPNPDTAPPELDLNRISIVATPTVPSAPNGETQVTISYMVRDNKSGLGTVSFRLRDPQGIEHFYYHYHENFYGTYFNGDPTVWKQYTVTVLLPVGSAPGTWGLASMNLVDKAMNSKSYSFVEIIRFDPYVSTVSSPNGTITSKTSVPIGNSATHKVVGDGYVSGLPLTIQNTIVYSGTPTSLSWSVLLPSGWSFVSSSGNVGDRGPKQFQTDSLDWTWTTVPSGSVTFSYTVMAPPSATTSQSFVSLVGINNGSNLQFLANPDPLVISPMSLPKSSVHSADSNGDYKISLLELTRVIEIYNTRNGSIRTGAYSIKKGTDDGFETDSSRNISVIMPYYHSADINKDGKISLTELTRVIELYNYRSGSVRTGQYKVQSGTEDGFSPGL